ncbi:hypothetical protein F5883DRAFT_174873 [Diaporthe sp. PMI_573]|nr:hypothetical protein F5883DRAFT_174873 [Diaporthaceae sp. PMI_573]
MYTPFLSHIITGAILAAANALAVPVTTTDDQPDGYYSVQYNDDGTSTPLDFIPFADLNITGSTAVIAERDPISYAPELEPRKTKVQCETGPLNEQDLVNAWTCLMSVGGGVTYKKNVWAWVL